MPEMIVFTGNANPQLAADIAAHLEKALGRAIVGTFSDGEVMVEILEHVRGHHAFIVQSTCAPANDHLMELMAMADALRRASAARITAVIPYFGYARQDRRIRSARVPITAKVVADMLASVGISRVITVDLHADQIQGFFYMPVDNVYATPLFLDHMVKNHQPDHRLVISPDVGGVVRARAFAKKLGDIGIAIVDKRRSSPNRSEALTIVGEVQDKVCLIVDDIIDTAGTLCSAAEKLKAQGALSVTAYITHPVLSGQAIEALTASAIDQLIVSDTIPLKEAAKTCQKIKQLSLSKMLAEVISRAHQEESISSLFL